MGKSATASSHPLKDYIPGPAWYDNYKSRTIGGYRDIALLDYCKDNSRNVVMFGPPGPGKTSLVMAYGAFYKRPVVTVMCNNGIDPKTLFGMWGPDPSDPEGKRLIWHYSDLVKVIRDGGVLYFDEVNFAPQRVMSVINALLDGRRFIVIPELGGEVVFAHEHDDTCDVDAEGNYLCGKELLVCAAYNPGLQGTKRLNEAFKDRFSVKLRFDYDAVIESQLLCMPVMLEIANDLRNAYKNGVLETPTSTRMLITFEELCLDISVDFAIENFINAFEEHEVPAVKAFFNDVRMDEIQKQAKKMEADAVAASTP